MDELSESTGSQVKINATVIGSVNYAMSHNSVPVMSDLEITNLTDRTFTNVNVIISSNPGFLIEHTVRFDRIDPAGVVCDSLRSSSSSGMVRINAEFMMNVTERVSGHVRIEVSSKGEVLASRTFDMTALAFEEWPGINYSELISAFVTPNDPVLAQIRDGASSVLTSWGKSGSLEGYQTGDRLRAKEQVAAIYNAVKKLNINYVNPPASFEKQGQRIRPIHDMLNFREGSCLDLSVLFASVLESIGMNPIIIFVNGHAFAGAWLEDSFFPNIVTFDPAEISRRVRDDTMCVVECTAATSGRGTDFVTACELAFNRLDPSDFNKAVDIRKARHTIRPIPVRNLVDGKWTVQREASKIDKEPDLSVRPKYEPKQKKEETKIELWERKLLDTSSRNNLINMRFTKKMIPLMAGDLSELMKLVTSDKKFQLHPKPQEWSGTKTFEQYPHECEKYIENCRESSISDLGQKIVRTPLNQSDLNSKIVTLFRESKKNMEESGSASLYVAVGMLKWYEDADIRYAPLILVPVSVERQSSVKYHIKAVDDDIIFNTTLVEKLRNEHKIDIGLELGDDTDIEEVFVRTLGVIQGMKGWDVVRSAALGIFSFNRFVMWRDLRSFRDELTKNKLVKSLTESKMTWDEGMVDENTEPYDMCLTVSADSSQVRAVKAACKGKTFVLHGPPGTGKSQTITNIISNALYNNKTVLFVAEKIAALDVVAKRLDGIGIGKHCLKLHSNKAQTKILLAQIKDVMNNDSASDKALWSIKTMAEARKDLSMYADELHRRRDCGMSVYDIISLYESTEEKDLFDVPISEGLMNSYVSEEEEGMTRTVERLIGASANVDLSPSNPFRNIRLSKTAYDIEGQAAGAIKEIREAHSMVGGISRSLDMSMIPIGLDDRVKVKELFDDLDSIDTDMIRNAALFEQGSTIAALKNKAEEAVALLEEISRPSSDVKSTVPSLLDVLGRMRQCVSALTSAKYPGPLSSTERLAERSGELERLYRSASEHMTEMNRVWKPSPFDADDIKREWAAVNGKKLFRGGAVKKFMESVSVHLADITVQFESIPEKLALADRYASAVSEIRGFAKDHLFRNSAELRKELTALGTYLSKAENNSRVMSKYALDRQKAVDVHGYITGNRDAVAEASERYRKRKEAIEGFALLLNIGLNQTGLKDPEACLRFCDEISAHLKDLPDWVNWNIRREEAVSANLDQMTEMIEQGKDAGKLIPSLLRSLYRSLAKREIGMSPYLSKFNSYDFTSTVRTFRDNDKKLMELNKDSLISKLWDKVPPRTEKSPQISELYKLSERQTVRRSVRKIFTQINELLPRLFPCMLMSPLSASQYLSADSPKFDIVIFDEASQIPTEEAIGAVARGKSAVIVGDPKQLPPTSFFETRVGMGEDDEEDLDDTESFLDDCLGLPLPDSYLEWHYRSKHESLIAFSNQKYYDNRMQTFPSPNDLETKVSLRMIDGEYGRGSDRTNKEEAKAIAEEVVLRLRKDPKKSIGIVAFSKAQQDCVEDALDERTKNDNALYDLMYDQEEPIFVKNLETVQGDERDVILFSIGYGRGANGKVSMNFGPINKPGGQKRLNVAVSRARHEMVVFSSMSAEDIAVRPESPEGVKNLRSFIEYASKGGTFTERDRSSGSGIPKSIAKELNKMGYKTHFKVGRTKFSVDLAVLSEKDDKRYMLGILCDGQSYIDSDSRSRNKNACKLNERDREFARTDFLAISGWEIIRVSPVEWFSQKERTLERLREKLEDVKQKEAARK